MLATAPRVTGAVGHVAVWEETGKSLASSLIYTLFKLWWLAARVVCAY